MSSFKENLLKARGGIVFLVGLTAAFATVVSLENWEPIQQVPIAKIDTSPIEGDAATAVELRAHRKLTAQEREWASVAWKYFENNYNEETGLVNSTDQYPASTLWDTSSYLLGMISAFQLDLIDRKTFYKRTAKLLRTLATLDLFDEQLPNKSYNTLTTKMVTYNNSETERGIGWSAIDIGRFMVPLNVLVWKYPEFSVAVKKVLDRWDIEAIARNGDMYGADLDEQGNTIYLQEGRLGYEEYAAKALSLVGIDVSNALSYELNLGLENIYGQMIGVDLRTPEKFGALNYVVSEPYVLDGVEYGWDLKSKELAQRLFLVQKARYEDTGFVTAVSEDNVDRPPYFVYNTVFSAGKAWNAVTESGEDASDLRSLSTKAAVGLYALFDTDYSDVLIDAIGTNFDPELGWYSGIYEKSGEVNKAITANTNGIILESLHYIENGPLVSLYSRKGVVVAEASED